MLEREALWPQGRLVAVGERAETRGLLLWGQMLVGGGLSPAETRTQQGWVCWDS